MANSPPPPIGEILQHVSTSRPRPDLFPPGNGGKYIEFVIPGEGTALVVIYPDARPPIAAKLVSWTPVKVASPPATTASGAPTGSKDDKPDNKAKKEKEKEKEKTTAQKLAEQSGLKDVADEVKGKKNPKPTVAGSSEPYQISGASTYFYSEGKKQIAQLAYMSNGETWLKGPGGQETYQKFKSRDAAQEWLLAHQKPLTKQGDAGPVVVAGSPPSSTEPTKSPPQGQGWKPDGKGGFSRPLFYQGVQKGTQVWINGEIDTKGFGTWNDTVAQAGQGIPPVTGLADAAAEIAAKKRAAAVARATAEKRQQEEEARQRAAALAAAQGTGSQGSGGQNSGDGNPSQAKPNRITVRGGQAPDKVSGEVYTVTTNRDTGVKTYVMLDGRVYSQGPGGNAYLAGRDDSNERILAYQQDQVEKSVAALNSRGGSVGDWGAAATIAKDGSVNTPSHKPGTVLTPTSSKPSPEAVRPSWASGATADQIATSIESHTEKKESNYPILSDADYASDNQRDPIEILDKDDPSREKPGAAAADSTYGGGGGTGDGGDNQLDPAIQTAIENQPPQIDYSTDIRDEAEILKPAVKPAEQSVREIPLDPAIAAAMNNRPAPAWTSISKETAEAAKLPDTNLVDKHYAITDLSSPRDIYAPNPDKPSELMPLDGLNADPNHNMGGGPMAS